ncbi:hypothetical protein F7C95_04840 [Opitutia bacterium ISCC 51]|nr:hypothetical protein F7C95_04840 [Opitutae bacterium ISCC 51]QXD29301.1 hypothetical protein GA003_04820 [Opitutae bacterium ISCC 52]
MRRPHQRKRVIEERDDRHKEKEINHSMEVKVVIWGSVAVFFIVTVFFLLRDDGEKNWSSARPGTVDSNFGKRSDEDSFPINTFDSIQPEEANAIVIAYMKHLTGMRPSMALRSALPNKEGTFWHMDLYYLDKEKAGEHENRQVLLHKGIGNIKSEGLPSMTLQELAEKSSLQIRDE